MNSKTHTPLMVTESSPTGTGCKPVAGEGTIQEEWRNVAGYEGVYHVSNLGKIKSLKHQKCVSIYNRKNEYATVKLSKNGKKRTVSVHRLVAIAFLGDELSFNDVNHIDGNKHNNSSANLEFCTRKQNMAHAKSIGLMGEHPAKGKFGSNSLSSKKIIQKDLHGNFIKEWGSVIEAANELKISKSGISNCCCGSLKKFKGFTWKHKTNEHDINE